MRIQSSSFEPREGDATGPLETEGYVCNNAGGMLQLQKVLLPSLGARMIEVEIKMVGLCHTDIHMRDNDWGVSDYPILAGHEGIGYVRRIGEDVRRIKVGDRIGIGWIRNSCGECGKCRIGRENLCASGFQGTYLGKSAGKWGKDGLKYNEHGGCFARVQRIDERFAIKIPEGLDDELVCPLLCGGGTVYEPLSEYGGVNVKVGVVGIGGLGVCAIKLGRLKGCVVYALSTTEEKREKCLQIGANEFVNLKKEKEVGGVEEMLDVIIDTSPSDADGVGMFLKMLKAGGKYVKVGIPGGEQKVEVSWVDLIFMERSVEGSSVTGCGRMEEMMEVVGRNWDFIKKGDWKVEKCAMSEINECMKKLLNRSNHGFRYVLQWDVVA